MTGVSPATQIINHVRVPTCCVYLLMMTAVVALMVLVALAASEAAEVPTQQVSNNADIQTQLETFNEPTGSIDPYAPFYGEGDMIEQSVVFFDQRPVNNGASGACILPVYCW